MLFDINESELSNYEKCQRLTSFDPCDLPIQEATAQDEVQTALTMPLGNLYNQLERLKRPTMEYKGDVSELKRLQNQLIALQNNIKTMLQNASDELVNEWNELI